MNATVDFFATLNSNAELHPDLVPYLSDTPFPMLRHPLVYQVPYAPPLAGWCNLAYEQKQKAIQAHEVIGSYSSIIALHERPYRVEILAEYADRMTDEEFWRTFAWVWRDTENAPQCWATWRQLMRCGRPAREYLMTPEERQYLAQLPEMITVWRGQTAGEPIEDFSWTLSRPVATWFARRFDNRNGILVEGLVRKIDVIAYMAARGEAEIMAWPEAVVTVRAIKPSRTAR